MNPDDLKGVLAGVLENTDSLESQLKMNFAKKLFDKAEGAEANTKPLGIAIKKEGAELLALFLYREPTQTDTITERETLFLLSAGLESVISMMNLNEEQVKNYLSYLKNLLFPKFEKGEILYFHGENKSFNLSYNGIDWEAIKLVQFVEIEKIIQAVINPEAGEAEALEDKKE